MITRPLFAGLRDRILQRNQRYRLVFAGSVGAFVRDDLFRLGHLGRPTYVPGDPVATAFNEGKRFVALHVASILNLSDEEIVERAQAIPRDITIDQETAHD
jgi:hypothetical protein